MEGSKAPLSSHSGGPAGVAGGPQPSIAERADLEAQNEALRSARADAETALRRYTELFESAPIGYAELDAVGAIEELNQEASTLLGIARDRLVGRRFADLVTAGDRARFEALVGDALRDGARGAGEFTVRCETGDTRCMRFHAGPFRDGGPGALLAFDDVTERHAREERLAQTERALRESDKRKDDFLAMLGHELRNPLAPIRSSLYVLSHAGPDSGYVKKAHAIVERQVAHLTRLVDDLLDITRINSGKIELKYGRVELANLVYRAMEDHRIEFDRRGIVLEREFCEGPCWVRADAVRLTQVVSNLLGNALKFTPPGGRVVVRLEDEGLAVMVRVRDTGAGIEASLLEAVFEPFHQAPQTLARSAGGLGLGLAMVRGIVEMHGGWVLAQSDGPGRGAEFIVSIPRDAPAPIATVPPPAAASAAPRKVLVIEDNRDAAESLVDALSFEGHDAKAAFDGPTGLSLAQAFRPDVVFCDIGLPRMDGYEVAKAFRARDDLRGTYLVALTGYARPEDVKRAAAAGFDRHVAKPPTLEEVDRVLAEAPRSAESA